MSVTLHTSHGDVKVEMFCDLAPSTCEVRPTEAIARAFPAFLRSLASIAKTKR